MAEDHIVISSGRSLTYDEVAARTFTSSFRGFDQAEVRLFLKRVGDELLALAENERQLRLSLDEARERAAHPEIDEKTLTAALGEQTTRVLQSAREAATDIRNKAEENAARVRSEAEGDVPKKGKKKCRKMSIPPTHSQPLCLRAWKKVASSIMLPV